MECREAQEQILESLTGNRPVTDQRDLQSHLAVCQSCRSFSEVQLMLDLQLGAAISAPTLSPEFRAILMKKVRREPLSVWPVFLPEVAHVMGCVCATVVCLMMLPFSV